MPSSGILFTAESSSGMIFLFFRILFMAVDICLADTGIAGPSGATDGKSVGLFYIGMANQGGVFSQRHEFHGSREQNKRSAAEAALAWLKEYLLSS